MKHKIHVLQFVPDLGKDSGITHVLMEYFRLISDDVVYDFVYFNDTKNDCKTEINSLGGVVFKLPSPFNLISFNKSWKKFCKKNYGKFDAFENNLPFLDILFSNVKKQLNVNVSITHSHATKFGDRKFSDVRNKIFYTITGRHVGDVLFSCSKEAGIKIFGKKCQSKKWYIINNAFNISKFEFNKSQRENVRSRMGWTGKKIIGNVGRLVPQKNQETMLQSFAKLKQKDCLLVIVGEGYMKEKLLLEAKRLGIEKRVTFLGARNDISDLLQAFDVFFFPSIFEGLGVSLVEAQISGLPSLISNTIPDEAIISNCVVVNLKSSMDIWAKELKKMVNLPRNINAVFEAEKHGFNIDIESKKLITRYKKILLRSYND